MGSRDSLRSMLTSKQMPLLPPGSVSDFTGGPGQEGGSPVPGYMHLVG